MEIQRFDKRPGCSRVVIHNHVAYFTGHVAAGKQPTLREQGEAVLKRYDELFERFGLKKENILYSNAYVQDISKYKEGTRIYHKKFGECPCWRYRSSLVCRSRLSA